MLRVCKNLKCKIELEGFRLKKNRCPFCKSHLQRYSFPGSKIKTRATIGGLHGSNNFRFQKVSDMSPNF